MFVSSLNGAYHHVARLILERCAQSHALIKWIVYPTKYGMWLAMDHTWRMGGYHLKIGRLPHLMENPPNSLLSGASSTLLCHVSLHAFPPTLGASTLHCVTHLLNDTCFRPCHLSMHVDYLKLGASSS